MEYELYHWGVKGMKWGIRRYQNKDGTLTAAGKKRYDRELARVEEAERTAKNRAATQAKIDALNARKAVLRGDGNTTVSSPTKRAAKDMSDKELNDAINRKTLENRYNELYKDPVQAKKSNSFNKDVLAPAMLNAGKKIANAALDKIADVALKKMGVGGKDTYELLKKEYDLLDIKSKIKKLKNPDDDKDMSRLEKAAKKAGYEKTIAEAEMKVRKNEKEKQSSSNNTVDNGRKVVDNILDDIGEVVIVKTDDDD